ncbi:unnamed protein product, partial [Mesorhabditis belari]
MRSKFLFQLTFELFELVDSISYILTGVGRGSGLLGGYFTTPITVNDCFFKTYWVHSLILGMELPCYMVILMSIERICAALKPALYKKYFSGAQKMWFVTIVITGGLISLFMAGLSADGDTTLTGTHHCAIITSTSKTYSTFHFAIVIVAYLVSFFSLLIVYLVSKHVEGMIARRDREKKISLMLGICGISMVLVSLPSIVMIGIKWGLWVVSDLVVALTYGMPGCLTIANTCINLIFRKDYREQFIGIFGVHAEKMTNKVQISVTQSPSLHSHAPSPQIFRSIAQMAMTKVEP